MGFAQTNLLAIPLPAGMSGAERFLAEFLDRIDEYRERREFPGGARAIVLVGTPALRNGVGTAACAPGPGDRRAWCGNVVERAHLARLLLPDPLAPPASRGRRLSPRVRCDRVAEPAWPFRGMARGPHRVPTCGRGHAADQRFGLHAQSAANGRWHRSW